MHLRALPLALALAGLVACGDSGTAPADDPDAGGDPADVADEPDDPGPGRLITIGDNVASNPSYATGWVALLAANDDELFPAFAGHDLATMWPQLELVRLDRGGDSYRALAASPGTLCTCAPPDCPADQACVDTESDVPTIVIVQLGVNDVFALLLQMLNDEALLADPSAATDQFRLDVRAVLERAADDLAAVSHQLVVTTIYDPSDGTGDVTEIATALFPVEDVEALAGQAVVDLLATHNAVLAEEAEAVGATLVDVHGHFLGHGLFHDDEANPHHDPEDTTSWYLGVVDPNLRGAHELRRVIWEALTGEAITAVPTDLPLDSQVGLPEVPEVGWANEVVAIDVAVELTDGDGETFPNLATDGALVLGPPEGDIGGLLAVGEVGDYVVIDLGGGEVALDGEGEDLVILEYGLASGGIPEPYRVQVSDAPDGPWTTLGDGSGERAFDLADAGLASARYVRVESLAQVVDILGGLGSPYWPGPELDAIGAVYPGDAP